MYHVQICEMHIENFTGGPGVMRPFAKSTRRYKDNIKTGERV